MKTDVEIDDELLDEAQKVGGQKTKEAIVTEAPQEYVQRHKQKRITEIFGTIDFDPDYDYKEGRRRR